MIALPWPYLAFLSLGYCLALSYGQLTAQALIPLFALILAGLAARQQRQQWLRYAGHGLFVLLALALALHCYPVSIMAAPSTLSG